jgi:transcriptional regulator with XRE-family HTH domain
MVDYEYVEDEALIDAQIKRCAQRLRKEREKLRLSQMELSFKAGLSQNQVNYIETGKRSPTLYTILKLCNALHINPSILFDTDDEEERQRDFRTAINLISKYL